MAETKKSGYNAPVKGITIPKGATYVKQSDGRYKIVPPTKKTKKSK